ncbi:uncharacterized protein LOC117641260 [Thrips palmi]|uniref:Uncharacterized protein LOC117641260 n=1 Tax=Thrips palmi TaxID=161013 RepID=A0A6P8YBX7_THRPL|nr:uncharacterized protein LOC117641260 [Thrips palmi]
MEPLAGGVSPVKNNFPAVYQRLLGNGGVDAAPGPWRPWPASRRWINVELPDWLTTHAAFGAHDAAGTAASSATSSSITVSPPAKAVPTDVGAGVGLGSATDAALEVPTASPLASLAGGGFTLPSNATPESITPGSVDRAALRQRTKKLKMRQKIAKFLNLFTVVQFSNDACEAPAVGLTGTCYHHLQCRSLGGHPGGACAQGYGVCCLFEKTCGGTTRHNSTYFVSSPTALEGVDAVDGYVNCFITVEKLNPDVTQLRLDFLHFELAAPTEGTCLEERFVVVSPDRNAPTPALCGTNTGQHMYVQVGSAGGTYHDGHAGLVQSFGYLGPGLGSYTNNLNYAVCIRKEAGFCSVTYTTESTNGTSMPFQLLNVDQDGAPTIPPGQAGAEVFNCPNDYIAINGIRLCGERLNDASLDQDYTHNSPVTDSGSGPFVLPVRSNGNLTGRGFSLSYRQIACNDAREVGDDAAAMPF